MALDCPKCGKMLALFADYERNDTSALGLKCLNEKCDYKHTLKDADDKLARLRSKLFKLADGVYVGPGDTAWLVNTLVLSQEPWEMWVCCGANFQGVVDWWASEKGSRTDAAHSLEECVSTREAALEVREKLRVKK